MCSCEFRALVRLLLLVYPLACDYTYHRVAPSIMGQPEEPSTSAWHEHKNKQSCSSNASFHQVQCNKHRVQQASIATAIVAWILLLWRLCYLQSGVTISSCAALTNTSRILSLHNQKDSKLTSHHKISNRAWIHNLHLHVDVHAA